MKINTHTAYKSSHFKLQEFIEKFRNAGRILADGNRNQIRVFELNGESVAIKAFKIPNVVNKIAYRFFRKSKARRSFEYASRILAKGILTPQPIAYAEDKNGLTFGESYYICRHLDYDLTYRDLVENELNEERVEILKAFTEFTFSMHEKGIHFLDHSPGNTLIVKKPEGYDFYLVDLNRMEFKPLDFNTRIKNFSRLTPKKEMVEIMAREYSRLAGYDYEQTLEAMWEETVLFQEHFHKKQQLKKKIKFWKK